MIRKKPPIAPKAAQHGLADGQSHLESRASPSVENGAQFGRPRSPRPSEVYNAAMAELNGGDGRGLTKVKIAGGLSPVSSPNRRRAVSSVTPGSIPLHPLSPSATSILDHSNSGGRATSSSGAAMFMLASSSARALSALEEQLPVGGPTDASSGGLPNTPPRKATSAPDSQSVLAQMRTSVNPWRAGPGEPLAPLSDRPHAHQLAPAVSPRTTAAPSPPQSHGPAHGHAPRPVGGGSGDAGGAAASGRAHTGQAAGAAAAAAAAQGQGQLANGLPPASMSPVATGGGGSGGGGRQRRDSASSTESHSTGAYDSPVAGSGGQQPSSLRVATLGRTGSPNSPSTPSASCSSQPHTPTFSALRPRPPGEAPTPAARSSRKFSHLASPETRAGQPQQQQQQPQPQPQQAGAQAQQAQEQQAQQQAASGLGAARQLRLQTGQDDGAPQWFRSNSLRSEGGGGPGSATAAAAAAAAALALYGGSQPGTPSSAASASRPSSGRGGSARVSARPVAALVDAVRSRDDAKLAEVLEALRGPQGGISGLNDRHHVTGRTPLHEAAMSNSPSMVAMLLAAGADPNVGHPTQGPPLLHCAAFGELETMLLLLQRGADVHTTDIERSTPLHFACVGGHVDAARLLIKSGADVRARNEEGQAPFDLAAPEMLRLVMAAAAAASPGDGDAACGEAVTSPERPSPPSSASAARRMSEAAAAAAAARAAAAEVASEGGAPAGPSSRGGSGGVRRRGSGGGGKPPSGSSGGGMVSSPTVQIDTSAAAAAGAAAAALRPAPPSADPQTVTLAPHPRSRRNSGTIAPSAVTPTAGPAASAPTPPGAGASPLRRNSGGGTAAEGAAAACSAATTPTPAPTSPLLSDGEAAPPPASPPTLQLPGGVRRQLSRGAVLGDIMSAFRQEDAEMVRKSQCLPAHGGAAGAAADASAHVSSSSAAAARPPAGPAPAHHPPPGIPAGPSAGAGKGKDAHPAVAPVGFTPPGGPAGRAQPRAPAPAPAPALEQGKGKEPPPEDQQEQQPLIPFNMPETSVIRFGFRLQVHGPEEDGNSGQQQQPVAADASRQPSGASPMPSFSSGVAPCGFGFPAAGAPPQEQPPQQRQLQRAESSGHGVGFNAVGFSPVPATGFTPRFSSNGGGGGGAAAAAAAGHRMSGSGDDFGAPPPPLMRDSSPVRNRPSTSGAPGGAAGAGGAAAAAAGGSGGGQLAPTRSSQMAAQALMRMSHMNNNSMSMDAIEVRAAAMFRQSTELTMGEMMWTKGELLGEGAYGKVYAGLNQQTGELMAVKVLQLVTKAGSSSKEAIAQLESLEHEMSLYKKLKHKHVVGYIDARYDASTSAFYIFLEYVPGGSIASMLTRFGRFSEDLVRNYTRQLLLGLEYLHGRKIVHRDLKGGNVLVSRDGVVKLADFGASKAYRDHTITDCMKSVRGSVFWMAPEVIRGTGYGRRADIWSLGCTVIEMLSGTHPWPALDNQWTAMFTIAKTEEGPPRPRGISDEAARFLDKCLQFDPAKRPTAAELLQDPFVARPGGGPASGEDRLQHSF